MNLNQISNGEPVLIDANIILYAIRNASVQCIQLLRRCSQGQVIGIITTHIVAEVTHRLMMAEARENGWITAANPTRQLSQQPERVKMLVRYEQAVRSLLAMGLQFEPIEKEDIITALRVQREAGLLTNDALLVAVAQRMRVTALASADQSFANVLGLLHYAPDDVET
jgi:predicted nucleic acid-binding protein